MIAYYVIIVPQLEKICYRYENTQFSCWLYESNTFPSPGSLENLLKFSSGKKVKTFDALTAPLPLFA